MKFTIFTATYNRAYRLSELYHSLMAQTYTDFEWIIVDDGSNDHTKEIITNFIQEQKINIRFFFQKNNGKHTAINKGVKEAKGELFFIVDSDDVLPGNALQKVVKYYEKIESNLNIGGVSGRKAFFDNKIVGHNVNFVPVISDALRIRYKEKIMGDLAEVFKTEILREFPFPVYENEKFCPEALVWNRIAQKYSLLYFNEAIYKCEYLKDGLTSKIVKIRMDSPKASMVNYSELESYRIPLFQKIKANINFWRFSFNSDYSFFNKLRMISILISCIGLPFGFLMYLKDKRINK